MTVILTVVSMLIALASVTVRMWILFFPGLGIKFHYSHIILRLVLSVSAFGLALLAYNRTATTLQFAFVIVALVIPLLGSVLNPARILLSLNKPLRFAASESELAEDTRVVGVVVNGEANAYPLDLLQLYPVVNDQLGGKPVLVAWCAGTNVVAAYIPEVEETGINFDFETFFRSQLILRDRESGTLWQQADGEAAAGLLLNHSLEKLEARVCSLTEWKQAYPLSTLAEQPASWGGVLPRSWVLRLLAALPKI